MLSKQIFYLTNDQLCAYQWRKGVLSPGEVFANDTAGMAAFAHYLQGFTTIPAYVVADFVEEDFQRNSMPHVGGRAGRELVRRRLSQTYRDTPYRLVRFQGREPDGRRDDKVLCSALTNPAPIQALLAQIEQQEVPLAALYSATFLTTLLIDKLDLAQPHLLVVTLQSGGLRQSYFQGMDLKFSRLTASAGDDVDPPTIAIETNKIQQFLTSTRLLGRGEIMDVVVVADPSRIAELEVACSDSKEIAYQFIDSDTAAQRLKLAPARQVAATRARQGDHLLLSLIGKRSPPSHYDLGNQHRFYTIWRARIAMYAASVGVAVVAALWLMVSLYLMFLADSDSERLRKDTRQIDARYQDIVARMPATPTRTANMKAAVQVDAMLTKQAPVPGPIMALVSAALATVPQISISVLEWQVEQPLAFGAGAQSQMSTNSGGGPPPISANVLGIPEAPAQSLRIDGEVLLNQSDYRSALDSMNQLAAQLAKTPGMRVEVIEPPLDVRPSVKLAGKAGEPMPESRAKFSLKLVWKR